jgi:hypothetical protein
MPYVYKKAESLEGQPLVGTFQCAVLVQYYAKAPAPAREKWKQGADVKGNLLLEKGTAIATFVNGRYPNTLHNKHAAFYVGQEADGIWVIEQFDGLEKIQKRKLKWKGQAKDGSFIDPSNNGDAFSVIESL